VDIGETIEVKIEALKKHVSQVDTHEVDKWMYEWAEGAARPRNQICRGLSCDDFGKRKIRVNLGEAMSLAFFGGAGMRLNLYIQLDFASPLCYL